MRDLIRGIVATLLFSGMAAASAHGLHDASAAQHPGGLFQEFFHLFVVHGYWIIVLAAGYGLFLCRSMVIHRRLEQRRGGERGNNYHQHDRRE